MHVPTVSTENELDICTELSRLTCCRMRFLSLRFALNVKQALVYMKCKGEGEGTFFFKYPQPIRNLVMQPAQRNNNPIAVCVIGIGISAIRRSSY